MPQPRAGYMAGVIGEKYVIAGGSYWTKKQKHLSSRVDIFDPVRNTWTKGVPLPEPRTDAASVSYRGALYVWGGVTPDGVQRDAWVFRGHKWTPLPQAVLPEPRLYAMAVACGADIYVVGGMERAGDYSSVRRELWKWNPKTPEKGWETLDPMPGPGFINAAVTCAEGKVYVLGGATKGGPNVVNLNMAYEYDPQNRRWNIKSQLPVSRRCWWGMPWAGKILLLGGYTSTYEKDVFSYEISSGRLSKFGMLPRGMCDAKFLRIGNEVIGAGGETELGVRGRWTLEAKLPVGGTTARGLEH
jgi:N-acetylneuraminic acid mutarotase